MNTKPKLRKEASLELHHSIVAAAFRAIEKAEHYPFTSCINCFHFDEKKELCKMYKVRPPARVIAFGCETHEDQDDIPF